MKFAFNLSIIRIISKFSITLTVLTDLTKKSVYILHIYTESLIH